MSGWNPFGEDNFSKLTEEELIDREFDLLRASKWPSAVLPMAPGRSQPRLTCVSLCRQAGGEDGRRGARAVAGPVRLRPVRG